MIIHSKPPQEYHPAKRLGYLHVYTGDGKGKTSAALGVLLRAAGQKHRVLMVQFLKGHKDAGELLAVQELGKHVDIVQFGRDDLRSLNDIQAVDHYFANQALAFTREEMAQRRPDVLILDELTTVIDQDLVLLEDVIDLLDNRHANMEVVVTGRNAHPELLNRADLVTVMEPVKDYYGYRDFEPRLGIEH